jgi:hypothetical protein
MVDARSACGQERKGSDCRWPAAAPRFVQGRGAPFDLGPALQPTGQAGCRSDTQPGRSGLLVPSGCAARAKAAGRAHQYLLDLLATAAPALPATA